MRPNLLHLITSLKIGGTETCMAALCRAQKDAYNVYAGFVKEHGAIADEILNDGTPVEMFAGLRDICRFLKEKRIHILHTHLYRANMLGRVAGALCRTPVIISSQHGIDAWRRPHHAMLDRLTARFVDCIVPDSEAAKAKLLARERIPEHKLRMIHSSALDPAAFTCTRAREDVREELGIGADVPLLGCVARLHRAKGLDRLVPLARLVRDEVPDARIVVAGDGPLREELENGIGEAGLTGAVRLLGWRRDIPDILSALDVFFLPSREESFPRAVLEALVLERPVVAMDVGGVGEAIEDGVDGVLVPDGDVAGMAAAMVAVLGSGERAAAMGSHGRARVLREYTLEKMLDRTERLYRELIDRKLGAI